MPSISLSNAFGTSKVRRDRVATGRFTITVSMNEKLAKWLAEHSNSTGRSISEIVRGALMREARAQDVKKGLPEDIAAFWNPPPEDPV